MTKYVVRYGTMRSLCVLTPRGDERYVRGSRVIARTQRGLEASEVLCEATAETMQAMHDPPTGQILRAMTPEDVNELAHIKATEGDEFEICQQHVRNLGLGMELVDIEHLFGGERIVVYYLAEHRVDFRELVKQLASEFQTRIEMRQIGVRDEAKLLADYGDCGKAVCCGGHLAEMPPVSMRMAKLQKATLDPSKISGRCGRLKCCLRYEYETYSKLLKKLPQIGTDVETEFGRARVLGHEILTQHLFVQLEDGRRQLVDVNQVHRPAPKTKTPNEPREDKTDSSA